MAKKVTKKKKTTGNKPPHTSGARAILCESDEEWHAERAIGIGSSEVDALGGKPKYDTAIELFNKKTGKSEGTVQNEYMYWGLVHEPNVKREYVKRTGNKVFYRPRTLFVSKANPIFRVTPDGLLLGGDRHHRTSLQIKCTDVRKGWGEEGTDQMPMHIYCAAQWELGILGPEWVRCDFAVLFSGNDFRMYYAERNDRVIKELQKRADNFWKKHVLTNKPPEMSEERAEDPKVMAAAYPLEKEKIIKANDEVRKAIKDLEALRVSIGIDKETEERLRNEIRKVIGNNLGVLAELEGGDEVTYKWLESRSKRFDSKKFKADHPDVYAKFAVESVTRSLRRYGG